MKKLLKQLISFILVLSIGTSIPWFGISAFAETPGSYSGSCGNGAEWYLDNATGKLTISGIGSTGSYQAVSGVKAPWEKYKEDILYVEIGEGITVIGSGGFRDCKNLLDVSLPESLKEISEMSFSGCNKLQTIDIPTNVNKIDASAFFECPILEKITVSSQNTVFSDADGVLFNKNKTKLVLFPKGKITTEYTVPSGVTEIGAYAFANCSELINITIPTTVTVIGMYAFMNCRTLFTANIPEGVKSIGPNTFYGCSALYEVKLPSTITSIDSGAFGMCGSLMKINIPNATKNINATAFSGCSNLTVYCEKDSRANEFCISNKIDYCYSNLKSIYPVAAWSYGNVPHLGQRYARIDVKCTWEEAELVCEMFGGHLATVTSAEEMATIRSLLSNGAPYAYWLGASDEKAEGTWEWVTGEPFSYSLWSSGQPDDCGGVEDYLETWGRGESWNDNNMYGSSTEDTRGFVCEFENYYIPSKTIEYNGNIYYLFDELLSWYTAYNVCQNMGGHLATITSEEEQRVISELCSDSFYTAYWLGATDDSSEGVWKWVTGENFSYSKWNSGEPNNNNAGAAENYLEIYVSTDGWNDYIDDGYRGFICEIESQDNFSIIHDYHNGNSYEIYDTNVSWVNAQRIAQAKGGHLATVADADEKDFLANLYQDLTLSDDYLYIGGFRCKHNDRYRWVTGESFVYSNWNDGEPNNNQLVENFAQIYRYSNGWNDIGNKGSYYDGSVFIVEYESPKQVLTLSNPDGTLLNRYKVQGGIAVDKPLKNYKSGYTAEWYKDASLQNKWNFETDIITEDTVLYARWVADTYTVSFEANGGECNTESKEVTFGTSYGNLPVPTRDGYSFEGWYEDEAFTKSVTNITTVSVADNHTLYAKWQAKTYTVTFAGNGGTLTETTKTVVFGSPYGELPLCSRDGSDFLGWYSDSECTKTVDENTIVNVAGNHTLYAGWNESTVTKLQFKSKPTKTEYYVGDSLDTRGMSVVASFENGSSAEISADKFDYSLTEFTSAGKKIVKATYGGKYVSFIVNVSSRALSSVSVATLPNKLTYTVGEKLDTAGLVLKAVYDNSSTKTITEGFSATCDLSTSGTKTVTVNYTENGKTVSTSYQITVNPKTVEPDAIISATAVSVEAGETFSVPFKVESNKGFMGFAITVDYDSDAFTPVSVTSGATLSNGTLNDSIGTAYEYLKIVYVGSENVKTNGNLFTVNFVANENASGTFTFDVSYLQADTFNESLDDVILKCNDFNVTVSNLAVEQSVMFVGGSVDATAGSRVIVPVSVENGLGVNSFTLKMGYNSEVMSFVKSTDGAALSSGTVSTTVDELSEEITFAWSGSPITSDGVIFYVEFEIEELIQSNETLILSCRSIDFSGASAKDTLCTDAKVYITNPNGGNTPVIYSADSVRISDSIIEIPVCIKNNHGVMGFGINVEYDSSIIQPLSVTKGAILSDGSFDNNIGKTSGSFKVIWNNTENVNGNGLLFTLKFSVAEGAKPDFVPLTISFSQPDTYNEAWEDVAFNIDISEIPVKYAYTATFMHNGEIIGTDEFFNENEELNYPVMPSKPHYNWVWDEHKVEANDLTIEGRYVPIEYSIYYYCDGKLVSTDKYTVETTMEQIVLPEITEKVGYIGEWENFTLSAGDIVVNCVYSLEVYTATFIFEGKVVGTDSFTVEDNSLDFPTVESKEDYVIVWDDYNISAQNITVSGRYVADEYTISFVSGGKVIKTQKYTVETLDSIEVPELSLPEKAGYYSEWESWEGKIGNITVNEVYVAIEYKINFYCNGTLLATETFTVETDKSRITLPEIPVKTGYVGKWDEFTLGAQNIDVYCSYNPVMYTATFVDADGRIIGTDSFTVEDTSLNYPAVVGMAYYVWTWDEHSIEAKNLTIKGRYVPVTYTITFVSNGVTVKTQEYNINTVDSIVPPEKTLPAKQYYTSEWESWTGKVGNITVNEIYVPVKYELSFYCQNQLVSTCFYTIETSASQILIPKLPDIKGYNVKWPEFKLEYKNQSVNAICTPIVYMAEFVVDGMLYDIQTFTVETKELYEPEIPQKPGYIAVWSGYVLEAKNILIYAEYHVPEVVMKSRVTMDVDETTRIFASCNFEATRKVWSSSDTSVAVVDNHGNVTAVGKGECKITVVCYGRDSYGLPIEAVNETQVVVKEPINAETIKESFRAAFDEFFQVKLYDILYNFKKFLLVLFRYAY